MSHIVATSEGVRVNRQMCKTCIFRPGNLMHLEEGRVEQMVADATAADGQIPCHSTFDDDLQAVCNGFFTRHAPPTLRFAERLGVVVWVE